MTCPHGFVEEFHCSICGPNQGRKDDDGKLRWDLLPGDALEEIVKVLTFGAKKYGDRNWEKGMAWHRPFGALMRHAWAWWKGEENDPETGLSHMAHAGCCVLFLLGFALRKTVGDDRPRALPLHFQSVKKICYNCIHFSREEQNFVTDTTPCKFRGIHIKAQDSCYNWTINDKPGTVLTI